MSGVAVTGATGFLGRRLVDNLVATGQSVRAMVRDRATANLPDGVELVEGDVLSSDAWRALLRPGDRLVHLAYSQTCSSDEAVIGTNRMVEACVEAGISRLIHCSTASVYGVMTGEWVDETTPCQPLTAYGQQKLAIEETLRSLVQNRFDLVILRPTEVFGPGGKSLATLVGRLRHGSSLVNYLRVSLYGKRLMHLVPVETFLAAVCFVLDEDKNYGGEVFLVAEDEAEGNNYRHVEDVLRKGMGLPSRQFPPLPIPPCVLETILRLSGRPWVRTRTRFSSAKLKAEGFCKPLTFLAALDHFAAHLAQTTKGEG